MKKKPFLPPLRGAELMNLCRPLLSKDKLSAESLNREAITPTNEPLELLRSLSQAKPPGA